MRTPNTIAVTAALLLSWTCPAGAFIFGGGPKKFDCFGAWRVNASDVTSGDCKDGDPACDVDGAKDGKCTVGVAICGFEADPSNTSCTAAEVTSFDKIKVVPKKVAATLGIAAPLPPTVPLSAAACGPDTVVTIPLKVTKKGVEKPSKPITFLMTATAGKKDKDKLKVRCLPGSEPCPANASGGPSQLLLTTVKDGLGGDLDNGWLGISHNFPIVGSSVLNFCLSGCDASTNPSCTGTGKTGQNTVNGATFGAPLPLLAAGVPVCVVNRYNGDITTTANHATGVIDAAVHLLSDVFTTINVPKTVGSKQYGQVCPQCSGADIGQSGTCIGGANDGQVCRVDGSTRVALSTGNQDYKLSTSCKPPGAPIASLTIELVPFTSGQVSRGKCPNQAQDVANGCGTCNTACSLGQQTCLSMTTDPSDPTKQICVDAKGGLTQICCQDGKTSCFPTAGGGQIIRTGRATAPTPDAAGTPFPASSDVLLASVFCEPATGNGLLDALTAGLPGPGALLQPMAGRWLP